MVRILFYSSYLRYKKLMSNTGLAETFATVKGSMVAKTSLFYFRVLIDSKRLVLVFYFRFMNVFLN